MIKKGIAVTVIFGLSTLVQFLTQIVIARIFGASLSLDVFLAAVAIPTILVTVIYSTFNDAFLPLLGEQKAMSPQKVDEYFFSSLLTVSGITLIISLIIMATSTPLMTMLYGARGIPFVEESSYLMRYLLLAVPLASVATFLGSYYYARKEFIRFPFAQAAGSVANLLLILILAPFVGTWALVIGFVVNILIQILCVIPHSFSLSTPKPGNLVPFFMAAIPLVISAVAVRSDTLLIRSFGTQMPTGYLVYLNLISKIFSVSAGVVTIGIQVLLLPHLIEHFTKKEYAIAIARVRKAKLVAVMASVGVVILLILCAPLVLNWLFVGGQFSAEDAHTTSSLIPFFILPAIAWGINSVFFQPLIALKKQRELGIINVCALVAGWGIAYGVNIYFGPLPAIITGVTVLLFTGIIGSEVLWQTYKKQLIP